MKEVTTHIIDEGIQISPDRHETIRYNRVDLCVRVNGSYYIRIYATMVKDLKVDEIAGLRGYQLYIGTKDSVLDHQMALKNKVRNQNSMYEYSRRSRRVELRNLRLFTSYCS